MMESSTGCPFCVIKEDRMKKNIYRVITGTGVAAFMFMSLPGIIMAIEGIILRLKSSPIPFKMFTAIAVLTIFSLAACNRPVPTSVPASPAPTGDTITIARGTTGQIGRLMIGLGNTRVEDYVDSNGVNRNSLVAGISLYDERDNSTTNLAGLFGAEP